MRIQDLVVGNIYSNADIIETFRCGNMVVCISQTLLIPI